MSKKDQFDIVELLESETNEIYEAKMALKRATEWYKLGPPQRPDFKHDNGFLDKFPRRKPTIEDHKMFRKWEQMSDGARIACEKNSFFGLEWSIAKFFSECGKSEMPEANKAYYNFLYGQGKPMIIDYEKYIRDEEHGKKNVKTMAKEFIQHIELLGKNRERFSVTSARMIPIGSSKKLPGPYTVNWQRTIGSHQIWISADVAARAVSGKIVYSADLQFNIEDQFNFNPGKADEKTGIRDEENGMLELSGYGNQFMTYATIKRKLRWNAGELDSALLVGPDGQSRLSDNY